MSATPTLANSFQAELIPTRTQALGSILLALAIIVPTQSQTLLSRLGLPANIVDASKTQFHTHFDTILNSNLASQLALITFWAIVGLVTYLICWGAYNILIEARNEVTLSTAYTNRGHWHSPHGTLALKAVAALGLASALVGLRYGTALWIELAARFAARPTLTASGWVVLSVLGLAFEFYLVFVLVQLTFTPWYRAGNGETFTQR